MTTTTEPAKALTADDMRDAEQVKRANASGQDTRRVHPRPVAAAEQLGPMGSRLRRGGLFGARARLAGRSRDGRRSERGPGGVRRQVGRRRRGSSRCGRPDPRPEAGHHRPLVRRAADADPGRSRAGGGVGRDRSGPVPGRPAAADLGAAVRVAGPDQPGQLQPGGAADLRAVPVRLRQRGRRGRGASAVRDVRGPGTGQAPLPGGHRPTSIRGPRSRSTARTRSVALS